MVSISGVTSGQAETYYQKDNYYTNQEGQWQGKGAEALGLQGEVKKEDFLATIYGKAPDGSFAIQNGGEGQNHRAGVDLTFSAPKSVSIVSEVLGDTLVRDAHEKAVTEALRYVEKNFTQARQTQNGITEKVDTGNTIIAKFQHDTSRELDPQLHSHAVVMNMTQREDSQWRAISNEKLFENKMLIGQIYRNELAVNLKELGFAVKSDNKGFFEIQGVDKKLIDHFSQRKEQIAQKAQELKESGKYPDANGQKLKEIAALDSREVKKEVNMNTVKEAWNERLQAKGYSKEQLQTNIQRAAGEAKEWDVNRTSRMKNEYEVVKQAGKILTEQESTFKKEDMLKTAGKLSVGEYRISNLEAAFKEMNFKEMRQLDKNVYTTAEMQKIEKGIVDKVQKGQDSINAISTKEQAQQATGKFEQKENMKLTQGQKGAAEHILTSKDRYVGIQGDAGTGKTTMLKIVQETATKQGFEVKGLSPTGKGADELQKGSGIKSSTIDSFLATAKENIPKAEGKGVWIVDEASMVGSKKMSELVKAAEKENARVVLVGDTKQLQAVEAGKMFDKLQERGDLKTVRINEVQRQQDAGYKEITTALSDKKVDSALNKLEEQNRMKEISDKQERFNAIVKDYTAKDFKNTLVVTARNDDRNQLNKEIRDELKAQGKLKGEEQKFTVRESKNLNPTDKHFAQSYDKGDKVIASKAGIIGRAGAEGSITNVDQQNHKITTQTKDGKEHTIDLKKDGGNLASYKEKEQKFTTGDKVVFLKNDKGIDVKNGQTGEIKSIDEKGKTTIKMENGHEKTINLKSQYNYVDHGYVVTDFKSQGQTSKNVIYHADTQKGVNFNQAYVAITRGKEDVKVYTNDKENLAKQMKGEQGKTSTLDYKQVNKEIHKLERQFESGNKQQKDSISKKLDVHRDTYNNIRAKAEEVKKYEQCNRKLSSKDRKDLQKPATEKDLKKAVGLKSLVVDVRTKYDGEQGKLTVKSEKLWQACKDRFCDKVKIAFNKSLSPQNIGDKSYHTQRRTYDVHFKHKDGEITKAKQIATFESKQDGFFKKYESLTYMKNGDIYRFKAESIGRVTTETHEHLKNDKAEVQKDTAKAEVQKNTAKAEVQKPDKSETSKSDKAETEKAESSKPKTERTETEKTDKTEVENEKTENMKSDDREMER